MLTRLWWKEARTYWALVATVAALAVGGQGLMARSGLVVFQRGLLTPIALLWSAVYAFAISATAFAGEREGRTLVFLDALPVDRRTLWLGKLTYAYVSTALLAVGLLVFSMLGVEVRDESYALGPLVAGYGVLLTEAVAWGGFWSALYKNVLGAAALAVGTVGVIVTLAVGQVGPDANQMVQTAPLRLVLAVGALAASWWIMDGVPAKGRGRATGGLDREMVRAVRSLGWQTVREGRPIWLTLAVVGLIWPGAAAWWRGELQLVLVVGLGGLVSLSSGVCVFALENQGGTHRFLTARGARPALVWIVKVSVWAVTLVGYAVLLLGLVMLFQSSKQLAAELGVTGRRHVWLDFLTLSLLGLAQGFAVGQICGLVIRRWITAGLVAFAVLILLAPVQFGLLMLGMVPLGFLAMAPLILLGASWAWSGDWMLDRRGAAPVVRLALLLGLPFGLLVLGFASYRAWSIPDIGPPFDVGAVRSLTVPPDQNAAELYGQAARAIQQPFVEQTPIGGSLTLNVRSTRDPQIQHVIDDGWDPRADLAIRWWDANRDVIALVRRASRVPHAQFSRPDGTLFTGRTDGVGDPGDLVRLLLLDFRERQGRGDLDGAWDDVGVIFRMAGHMNDVTPGLYQAMTAAAMHGQAVRFALIWAADPRQTPERLREVLDDLRRLPPPPKLDDAIKVEHILTVQTLGLGASELGAYISGSSGGLSRSLPEQVMNSLFVPPPWERTRALRVLRLMTAEGLQLANEPAWKRIDPARRPQLEFDDLHWPPDQPGVFRSKDQLWFDLESTPLARALMPAVRSVFRVVDLEVAGRRALEQVIALRVWQLSHGGRYPDSLEALVPSILPELPLDPYSGRRFGYVQAQGQVLRPLEFSLADDVSSRATARPIREGQWLLYSVGPDGKDDRAMHSFTFQSTNTDMVFPLPEAGGPG